MFYQPEYYGNDIYQSFCVDTKGFPLHLHKCFELVYLIQGSMTATIDGTAYSLTKGEGVLVFPRQAHSFQAEEARVNVVIFSPDLVAHFYAFTKDSLPKSNRLWLPPSLFDQAEDANRYEIKGFLYDVCARAVKQFTLQKRKRSMEEHDLIDQILFFVMEHYQDGCSLKELAKTLKYDGNYLSKYIVQQIGIPFYQYVNEYRLGQACKMLEEGELRVGEVASRCGFSSARSFNRIFKQCKNTTPSAYRKEHKIEKLTADACNRNPNDSLTYG